MNITVNFQPEAGKTLKDAGTIEKVIEVPSVSALAGFVDCFTIILGNEVKSRLLILPIPEIFPSLVTNQFQYSLGASAASSILNSKITIDGYTIKKA